jgi:membrane protease YdiL (CAAX protease family)
VTSFAGRRPIAFSALAVLVPVVGMKVIHPALAALGLPDLGNRLVAEAAFGGYVVLLLWRLRWWREAGFTPASTRRRLAAWLPLLLLPLLVLAGSGVKAASAAHMIGFAIFTIMVAFAEEGLVRGIVLRALLPGGATRAAVLSSIIFGVGHLANIAQGAAPAATVVQVFVAAFLGIAFAGARLYGGTIWPAIALHALIDLVDVAGRGFALPQPQAMTVGRAVAPMVLTGACALYGWWLLRRLRKRDMAPP